MFPHVQLAIVLK